MQTLRKNSVDFALALTLCAGFVEALLLARLVARLLAARPDNPSIQLLYTLTGSLAAPFAALNYDQPPYGAALEFGTLVMAIAVPAVAYLAWIVLGRVATRGGRQAS